MRFEPRLLKWQANTLPFWQIGKWLPREIWDDQAIKGNHKVDFCLLDRAASTFRPIFCYFLCKVLTSSGAIKYSEGRHLEPTSVGEISSDFPPQMKDGIPYHFRPKINAKKCRNGGKSEYPMNLSLFRTESPSRLEICYSQVSLWLQSLAYLFPSLYHCLGEQISKALGPLAHPVNI